MDVQSDVLSMSNQVKAMLGFDYDYEHFDEQQVVVQTIGDKKARLKLDVYCWIFETTIPEQDRWACTG